MLVRVEGQGSEGQPLGPWPLDVEQRTMEEVCSLRSIIVVSDIMALHMLCRDVLMWWPCMCQLDHPSKQDHIFPFRQEVK